MRLLHLSQACATQLLSSSALSALNICSLITWPSPSFLFCFFWIPPLFLVLMISFVVLTFLPVLTQSSGRSSLPPILQSPRPFLPVPYFCVHSFSADSEVEKEQWLEAMQGAIAEALSTSEVAERIWAAAPNRFCADCGASQPDWASINLCVVICKRCAGRCVCNRLEPLFLMLLQHYWLFFWE